MNDAHRYIRTLTGSASTPMTWQGFRDNADSTVPAIIDHGALDDLLPDLFAYNEAGGGIFATVNETDMRGRKKGNIVRVRALFIETDGGKIPANFHIEPSIVVRSRNGLHCYWRVHDCGLDQFTPAQKRLIQHYGSDPAIHDINRVLRVPGFYHRKGEPFRVDLIHADPIGYRLADVLADLPELPAVERPVRVPVPASASGRGPVDWQAIDAVSVFADAGLLGRALGGGKYAVICPWASEHTKADLSGDGSSTVLWERGDNGVPVFHCSHAHCSGRYLYDAMLALGAELPRRVRVC